MYHPDYSLSATPPADLRSPAPVLPQASAGADFTDEWVSQAATATATGAVLSPRHDDDDWDNGGDDRPDSGMSGGRYDDDDDEDVEEEEDAEYHDQETVDEFEDRVLNKRAAKVSVLNSIPCFRFLKLYFISASLPHEETI